eukprot:scaffold184_cov316-Pinguiococcus_pyrenoidosus.AAC.58
MTLSPGDSLHTVPPGAHASSHEIPASKAPTSVVDGEDLVRSFAAQKSLIADLSGHQELPENDWIVLPAPRLPVQVSCVQVLRKSATGNEVRASVPTLLMWLERRQTDAHSGLSSSKAEQTKRGETCAEQRPKGRFLGQQQSYKASLHCLGVQAKRQQLGDNSQATTAKRQQPSDNSQETTATRERIRENQREPERTRERGRKRGSQQTNPESTSSSDW